MDDIVGKEVCGRQRETEKRKMYNSRSRDTRVIKVTVKNVNGRIVVKDVFGGEIVKRYGLMDHAREIEHSEDGNMDDEVDEQSDMSLVSKY